MKNQFMIDYGDRVKLVRLLRKVEIKKIARVLCIAEGEYETVEQNQRKAVMPEHKSVLKTLKNIIPPY